MSEARRGDTESMALTTTSTSVDELASLVLQIKSIPTTSSETNDILKKLQTLHKKIAAEIWSQMEPQQKAQFPSFDAFFQSGIWCPSSISKTQP